MEYNKKVLLISLAMLLFFSSSIMVSANTIISEEGVTSNFLNSTGQLYANGNRIDNFLSQILNFNYYNSSDFSISDYFTKNEVLGFNYYNSTSLENISQLDNDFNYYNATTLVEANLNVNSSDYWDGVNSFNSSELEQQPNGNLGILDSFINNLIDNRVTQAFIQALGFFTSTEILNFDYFNTTNFPYTHLTNFTDDLGDRGYTHLSNFTNDIGLGGGASSISNYSNNFNVANVPYTGSTWTNLSDGAWLNITIPEGGKVMLAYSMNWEDLINEGQHQYYLRLSRNGTQIGNISKLTIDTTDVWGGSYPLEKTFMDSPSAGSYEYRVQYKIEGSATTSQTDINEGSFDAFVFETSTGLTGNYTNGGCWKYYSNGLFDSTNCTLIP